MDDFLLGLLWESRFYVLNCIKGECVMNYGWLSLFPPVVAVLLAIAALLAVIFIWNKKEKRPEV